MITQRQVFLNHVAQTSQAPLGLEIVKADGIYLWDKNGKSYIDLIAGISVSNLGHNHPAVIKAIHEQTNQYLHTLVYGEYILSPQVQLADLLQQNLPSNLDCTYFVNSGAEATEGALKLAKRFTGRTNIVACKKAYHGSTHGALSLISESFFTAPFRPLLPSVHHIEFNVDKDLEKIDKNTACVIMETVRGEIGVMCPENNYLQKVRQRCTEVGALLILDEIQVGCGRTGSLFAFEQYGIVPDILLLAKAFGGGMPLGAFISSREIMSSLTHHPFLGHITTFGGHPVCCAAGLASLKYIIEESELLSNVKTKADLFKKMLQHEAILEIRNAGLLMALQMPSNDFVMKVIHRCIQDGLITDWFLFNAESIRIAPPLTISTTEILKACTILLDAIQYTHKNG